MLINKDRKKLYMNCKSINLYQHFKKIRFGYLSKLYQFLSIGIILTYWMILSANKTIK